MQHFTNLGHKGTTKNAHLQESEHNFQKKDRFIYLQYNSITQREFTHR
jgi:hypothetical protein